MKKRLIASLLASSLVLPSVAYAELSANVATTSNYLWRGMEQTGGAAAVSGGIDYSSESGFYAGTWASNATWAESMSYELDLYAGYGGELGSVGYDVGYIYFAYPDEASGDMGFSEVYANFSISDLTLGVAVLASGEGADFGDTVYLSADYAFALSNDAELGLHLGSYSGDWLAEDSVDFGLTLSKDAFTFGVSKLSADNGDEDLKVYVAYAVDFEL
jgi:uncharacterized protein (TIGR02001 family)